uniref:Uncharacterized protein n=1 Tax=Alexandrium monilatum TaxID=311494 RepID=A0A7S4R007_9DINO
MERRLSSSRSLPALSLPPGGLPPASGPGTGTRASGTSGRGGEVGSLIPACYASHKAMARTFRTSPGLFSGGGLRMAGVQEKFITVDSRSRGVSSIAYQRRQLLLQESEVQRRSYMHNNWEVQPIMAGADLGTIHRDTR